MTPPAPATPARIAILGGGPAGNTLAILLRQRGVDVALFNGGKRPALQVGESVVPAIIPLLRQLGVEDAVRAISQHKPGVTFVMGGEPVELCFSSVRGILPDYAYNVPRPGFDEVLEAASRRAGVRMIDHAAVPVAGDGECAVVLRPESLAEVPEWLGRQPDLIVDATGRRRQLARMLKLPAREGPRRDTAYFAHFEGWQHPGPEGQVIISRLAAGGWSWQIPLPGRMSVGVVMPGAILSGLGTDPAGRLDAVIENDPWLSRHGAERRRISEVPVYANYQLITERGHGPGWVLMGDAFGFVDPMLSPGLWVAMHSAELLAKAITTEGNLRTVLTEYERKMFQLLESWQSLIAHFYDGSMMAAQAAGRKIRVRFPGPVSGLMERHVSRNFAAMCCGAWTCRAYSQGLLRFLTKHTWDCEPATYSIA